LDLPSCPISFKFSLNIIILKKGNIFVTIVVTNKKEVIMNTSSQFIMATHVLVTLAFRQILANKKRVMNSDMLALSVNTNPVVIRRTIGMLKKAGLINSQSGPKGGAVLGKAAKDISLAHVYQAVEDSVLFHMHYGEPNQRCAVGKNIQASLCGVLEEAQQAITQTLDKKTIYDIAQDIMERSVIAEKLASGITPLQIDEMISKEFAEMTRKNI
jgi:Rrf2 family protein